MTFQRMRNTGSTMQCAFHCIEGGCLLKKSSYEGNSTCLTSCRLCYPLVLWGKCLLHHFFGGDKVPGYKKDKHVLVPFSALSFSWIHFHSSPQHWPVFFQKGYLNLVCLYLCACNPVVLGHVNPTCKITTSICTHMQCSVRAVPAAVSSLNMARVFLEFACIKVFPTLLIFIV